MTAQARASTTPWLAAIPGAAAAVAALAGWGLTSVSLLVVAVACALAGGWRGVLDRLGEAFVWVSAVWIVIAEAFGVLRAPLLVAGWPARVLVSLVAVGVGAWAGAASSRRASVATPHTPTTATTRPAGVHAPLWAWLPTAAMVVLGAANRILPPSQGLRVYFASGDSIVHTEYALRVLVEGGITYVDDHYPVGWHALMAVAFGVTEPSGVLTPDLLVRALQASSGATLLLFAVLAAAMTRLGFLVAQAVGVRDRSLQGLVAAASGAAVLSVPSVMFAVRPSFQTLIYVGVTVAVALCCAAEEPSARHLTTIAAAVMVTAHGWALALPAVLVAWLFVAVPLVRRGRLAFVAATAAAAAVTGFWPIVASMRAVGVEGAAMGGYAEPLVWPVLVLGAAATVVLAGVAWASRTPWAAWGAVAAASALTVVEVMVLSARVGVPPLSYYLRKVLSIPTLMVVPLVLAAIALGLGLIARHVPVRLVAAAVGALLAVASVWGAQETVRFSLGQREANDVGDLLRPLYADGAADANHAWQAAPGAYRDVYVRQLLDLYRPADPIKPPPREPLPVPQECAIMAHLPHPSVVTATPDAAELRYRACGFPVRVIDVRQVPLTTVP